MPDEKQPSLSAVGEIRGFFEIFLPGLFLLLHIILLIYCAAPKGPAADFVKRLSGNVAAAASVVGLPLGYVLGLALRLMRTGFADWMSGYLVPFVPTGEKLISSAEKWWKVNGTKGELRLDEDKPIRHKEQVPYPCLMMAQVAKALPPQALNFYESRWLYERGGETPRTTSGILRLERFLLGLETSFVTTTPEDDTNPLINYNRTSLAIALGTIVEARRTRMEKTEL